MKTEGEILIIMFVICFMIGILLGYLYAKIETRPPKIPYPPAWLNPKYNEKPKDQ